MQNDPFSSLILGNETFKHCMALISVLGLEVTAPDFSNSRVKLLPPLSENSVAILSSELILEEL